MLDVYIKCNNRQKLMSRHVPALNKLLGLDNPPWTIEQDEFANGEFRFTYFENLNTSNKSEILERATTLMPRISAGPWDVYIDGVEGETEALYLRAQYTIQPNRSTAPALTSVLFETHHIELGGNNERN